MFVHDAVLEAVICGETDITTNKYEMKLQKLKKVDPVTGSYGLKSQFDLSFKLLLILMMCSVILLKHTQRRIAQIIICQVKK